MRTPLLCATATLLLAVFGTGCFGHAIEATNVQGDGVIREVRGPMFVGGIVGRHEFAPECTHGIARSDSWMPWWGIFVGIVTLGIVYPWRGAYECALPPGAAGIVNVHTPVVDTAAPQTEPPPDPFISE